MKLRTLILWWTIVLTCCQLNSYSQAPSQANNQARNESVSRSYLLSPDQLQEDWDSLRSILRKTPTDLYAYMEPQEVDHYYSSIQDSLHAPRSAQSFFKLVNPLLVGLKDIHTRIWLPRVHNPYALSGGYYLPIRIRILDDEVFVMADRNAIIPPGSQLVSINHTPLQAIIDTLEKHHYTDGEITNTRDRLIEENFFAYLPLYFPLDSIINLRYHPRGGKNDTTIHYRGIQRISETPVKKKKRKDKSSVEAPWKLELLNADRTAILTISSFSEASDAKYKKFLRKSFETINQEGISTLIIDIRNNRGGYINRGTELLSYLSDEPYQYVATSIVRSSSMLKRKIKKSIIMPGLAMKLFKGSIGKELVSGWNNPVGSYDTLRWDLVDPHPSKYLFEGELYLLTNGLSISNSALVRNAFSINDFGTVIGTPCGGTANGTFGNSVNFQLPHSGIAGRVSTIRITAEKNNFGYSTNALPPDYLVPDNIEDLLTDKDTQLEYTLKLIRSKK